MGSDHFAGKSSAREFLIGTENSIVEHLQFAWPRKKFYPLSPKLVCGDMRLTTLADVYRTLLGEGGEEICLSRAVLESAGRCIRRMTHPGR